MSNYEKNPEIENKIEISLIIDENHSTVIQLDLKKASDNSIAKLCMAICKKYNLSEKIQIKLMNQIKKEIKGIKSYNKKEIELGMVKRLYYESVNKSKERKAILAQEKKEKDEKKLCEFNFTPKINKSSNKLHDRKYLKIEDRLYYDYKKSSHKKGFEKYFDMAQLGDNNISDGFKKPLTKSSSNFFKQSNKETINSVDENIDTNRSHRSQSKKFTFHAGGSQRKNNFLNENQIENKNVTNSNLNQDKNTITKVTPTRKANDWERQDYSKNLNYTSDEINNLKKISSVSVERMEQTASFPNMQEINISKNQNNNNLAPQQLNENYNQGSMRAYKTQRAIVADNSNNMNPVSSHVANNNFINTFATIVNNENLNEVNQINQPKAFPFTSINEQDLLAKKNNYGKQFTFSNSITVTPANTHNYERKPSNNFSNNGNTYIEKYERSIGKNLNINGQLIQSNNSKATGMLENIQDNLINKSNIILQEKEPRDANISQNIILTDSSKIEENNNLKQILFSKGIQKRSYDMKENEEEENLLYSESYGITNVKVMTNLNKSSTTSNNKIIASTSDNKDFPNKLSERNKNSSSISKVIAKGTLNRPNTARVYTKVNVTHKLKNSRDTSSTSQIQNIQTYSTWYDRLHKSKEDYRTAKEEHIQKQINKVCPFRPKITELSRKILRNSKSTENHNQFLHRLANSKRTAGVFKDSKLVLFSRSNSHSINTFSVSRSKSLISGRKNFNSNTESMLSPIYVTQLSRDVISQKEKDSVSKKNYASTVQSDNVESEINIDNSEGIYLNTENNQCNNTYNKSKPLLTSRTEKNLESKKIRTLKEEKNLMEMSYQYFENKQKSKRILQEKCNQSIMKFKKNNLKELFEMIVSGNDLNTLPNHIKEKLLIPVCNTMNQEQLEFNFQNFYVVADEILNNFF